MFKSEKIFLFLLISGCLIISLVLVDALMDPAVLFRTAYARFTGEPDPSLDGVFQPEFAADQGGELSRDSSDLLQYGWDLFRSEGFGFEIHYPQQVVKKSIPNQDALNAGVGLNSETPVWEFRLDDPALYRGTNLVDASILIHVLEGKDQEAACSSFKQGSIYQTPRNQRDSLIETEINGIPFWKDEVLEGVMGEFYQRVSYRTFAKGACYEITQLIHFQNMDSIYEKEIVEFDQDLVLAELDQVLETFAFLDVTPTFPEQSYPEPKTLTSAVSKSASQYVDGLDVSHWQGTINWTKVANNGYVFTFAKGTEGVGWTDVKFHENMVNGTNAGVFMGVYHFARPDLGNSARDEANHFLEASGDYLNSGYLRPVLDLEVGGSLGKTALSNWLLEWMETVEDRTGIAPLIYTNPNFIYSYLTNAVTEYDLWVAHWTCEPEPSYYYPNTGKWSDWAFWQYYGPGGCGGNAGYVPGISTNIDLNIFNGVESGLQAYDAESHLWVSLTSDAYYYPAPYYADITGNVNGDTTGLIDYAFWWECTALGSDLAVVEGTCGALPDPPPGECAYNQVGMRCIDIQNEKQIAEHTYQDVGNYTAKVIVERGNEPPVEDRYKITTYNPIRGVVIDPSSPNIGVIDDLYSLSADVTLHTSVGGTLQVSVEEEVSGDLVTSACIPVVGDHESVETFDLSWTESNPVQKNYEIWTRYRPYGGCPIEDQDEKDSVKYYQIYWLNEKALLELSDDQNNDIFAGEVVELGSVEPFQPVELNFMVANPSTINPFQITGASFQNTSNVSNLEFDTALPLDVGPEEELPIVISFEVQSSGDFSFDVVLDHDASNPTPFQFSVQGSGVLSGNPIQSISALPLSPGESLQGVIYDLHVDTDLNPPVEGVLQVSIEDAEGLALDDPVCVEIPGAVPDSYGVDFSWTNPIGELSEYLIWARYREFGTCPVEDTDDYDLSQAYQVNWVEDSPVLSLLTAGAEPLADGGIDDLGEIAPYQVVEVEYTLENSSETTAYQITDVSFTSVDNMIDPSAVDQLPLEVGPGEGGTLRVQFMVEDPGAFSADMVLQHTASNSNPYTITLEGDGVLSSNPIQALSPQPISPGQVLIDENFNLQVAAEVDTPVAGALQIKVSDSEGVQVADPFCREISEPGAGLYTYHLSWIESDPGLQDYSISAEFYSREGCPPAGSPISELEKNYQVDWEEEAPELRLLNPAGTHLPSGETLSLGQYEYYQTVDLSYQLENVSSTTALEISDIRIENKSNLSQVEISSQTAFSVDPEGISALDLSFLVDGTGEFSFDLVITHNGSGPSPYRISLQGSGVMTDNPIKYVIPVQNSPGSSLIGTPFSLDVEVGLDVPDQGALQVSMIDKTTGAVGDSSCQNLIDNLDQPRTLSLVVNQAQPGSRGYTLLAQYQAQSSCSITEAGDSDLSQSYTIIWEEEIPSLEIKRADGSQISPGLIEDIGEREFYQSVQLTYQLRNTSNTTSLEIEALAAENLTNVEDVSLYPSGLITLAPGAVQEITLSFLVSAVEPFSLDLAATHSGENQSPYRFTMVGSGVMSVNPIRALNIEPASPGSSYVGEEFGMTLEVEIDPPAPGVLQVSLIRQDTSASMGNTCFEILGEHSFIDVDLTWTETNPGDHSYDIELAYGALGSCPLEVSADALLTETYQVAWSTYQPQLIVNRPEGVTIFDGAVDYIGVHDFFRFVEVTYLISNETETEPLIISSITPENLQNLREVLVEPAGDIVIQPGEAQEIKISFQVLTLDPYTFDLVWEHNGSNPSPYQTGMLGESNLNLGDAPRESWLYRFLESLIKSGFFLKLPIFGLILIRRKRR